MDQKIYEAIARLGLRFGLDVAAVGNHRHSAVELAVVGIVAALSMATRNSSYTPCMDWSACYYEPNAVLRWLECHPGLAGYVQAIGTVFAVVVAIYSPRVAEYFADRRALRERWQQTMQAVATLKIAAKQLTPRLSEIRRQLDTRREQIPSALEWNDWWDKDMLCPITPGIEFMHQFTSGAEANAIAPFVALREAVAEYNNLRLIARTGYPDYGTPAGWAKIWSEISAKLDNAQARCAYAIGFSSGLSGLGQG